MAGNYTDNNNSYTHHTTPAAKIFAALIFIFVAAIWLFVGYFMCQPCFEQWRVRSRQRRRVITVTAQINTTPVVVAVTGLSTPERTALDPSILSILPTAVYSLKDQNEKAECAVCLAEFKDGDKARMLPSCGHSFHVECIDKWLSSHSTCPLCRTVVSVVPQVPDLPV